jgi:hypothetical protein
VKWTEKRRWIEVDREDGLKWTEERKWSEIDRGEKME